MKMILLSLVFMLITGQMILAQNSDSLIFRKGINFYKQDKYLDAQKTFLQLLKKSPDSRFITATKLMLAKSYYKLDDYKLATIVCDNFVQLYDNSSYLDDIHFLKGEIFFKQKNYPDAVNQWMWIINNKSDARLRDKAGVYVFNTIRAYMSDSEISRLNREYSDDTFNGIIEIIQAQRLMEAGHQQEGLQRLQNFIQKNPYNLYADMARDLIASNSGANVSGNSLLILKSTQPASKSVSDAIAQGFYYAAYEMASRNPEKAVRIDTLALSSDVLSTLQNTMPVLKRKQPLAVLGPLDNDENATLALLSRYEYFPFISPVSSENGLAAVSPYAFQINPDAEIKGEFLAEHAVKELGLKTFAILAPADAYGQSIANSFENTVISNGGEVVEKQWYYEDTQDFSRQFKAIRNKGFYITYRDSVRAADSTLSDSTILAQFKEYRTEKLFADDNGRGDIDSTQVPSTGIDALFIATYPEYIPYIAPQFAFHNIECTLLGNEGWNDPDQLMQQRVYLNGLIYETAGFYDPGSWNYKEFESRFRKQMHVTPDMYHLLGYDIGKWMISHYQPGMSRQAFRDSLESGQTYQGILENISFDSKPRVNARLNIIKFYMGQLMKLE
ncbi:MAG: penicillin-binding protein activator [Calditrichia bacterium]